MRRRPGSHYRNVRLASGILLEAATSSDLGRQRASAMQRPDLPGVALEAFQAPTGLRRMCGACGLLCSEGPSCNVEASRSDPFQTQTRGYFEAKHAVLAAADRPQSLPLQMSPDVTRWISLNENIHGSHGSVHLRHAFFLDLKKHCPAKTAGTLQCSFHFIFPFFSFDSPL